VNVEQRIHFSASHLIILTKTLGSLQARYMVERNEALPLLAGVKDNSGTVRRYYIEAEEETWDCELAELAVQRL